MVEVIDLRKTLEVATQTLTIAGISHALIGGFALAHYGIYRTTQDIDLLVDGSDPEKVKTLMLTKGFKLIHESSDVLQFTGVGYLDLLLARRPLSLGMLKHAKSNNQLGVYILKAEDIIGLKIQAFTNDPSRELKDLNDIQELLINGKNLDWEMIEKYASMFSVWNKISHLKK